MSNNVSLNAMETRCGYVWQLHLCHKWIAVTDFCLRVGIQCHQLPLVVDLCISKAHLGKLSLS